MREAFRRGIRNPAVGLGHQSPREGIEIERAEMLSVQPHGFGSKGSRGEVDDCVLRLMPSSVNSSTSSSRDISRGHSLATIRPGKEIHERSGRKPASR